LAQYPILRKVDRGPGLGVDLVTMQRYLRVGHANQLRIEQRRQQITRSRRYRHVKQPGLSHIAAERAALVSIFDNQIAGIARLLVQIFKSQRHAVSM
jgi:hypothetical protein